MKTSDGAEINCKIKGNFRLKGIRDHQSCSRGRQGCAVALSADGSAFITAIEPRRNYIIRRASNLSKEAHIIAANVDQALLVVTLAHPATSTTFIDRFLASAEAYRVPVTIVVNNRILLDTAEDRDCWRR